MIKTRLIGQVPSSKKYIALTVVAQWVKTVANIVMMFILSNLLALILDGKIFDFASLLPYLCGILGVMIVRYLCGYFASKTSFYASSEVKKVLRQKMYQKLTRMGASYHERCQPQRSCKFLLKVLINLNFISASICHNFSMQCLHRLRFLLFWYLSVGRLHLCLLFVCHSSRFQLLPCKKSQSDF